MIHRFSRLSIVLTLAFVMIIELAGCEKLVNYTIEEHVQRAKDFESKGDLKAAIVELKNAVQKNPKSAQTRWLLGALYVRSNEGAAAEKELKKAREFGVNEESIAVPLGEAYLLQGKFQEILAQVMPSEKTSTRNRAKIMQLQGDAYLGLRKVAEGCDLFRQSLDLGTDNPPTHWGLAKCAVASRDLDLAKKHAEESVALDRKNAASWLLLGDIERLRGNTQAAEAAVSEALKVDPRNITALISHAMIEMALSKQPEAIKDIEKIRRLFPENPMGHYLHALIEFIQGKPKEALVSMQEVLRVAPDYPPALLLAGNMETAVGSYELAISHLFRFLKSQPGHSFGVKSLSAAMLKNHQPDAAIQALIPLLGTAAEDKDVNMLAGEALLRMGKLEQASKHFAKAAQLAPGDASTRTGLGVSLLGTGEVDRALAELAFASRQHSGEHAGKLLVLTLLSRKEYDRALQELATLEKHQPNNAELQNLKGGAYIGKQNWIEARQSFEKSLRIDPTNFSAAMNLTQLDLRDNKSDLAKDRFMTLLEKYPKDFRVMVALAGLAVSANNEDEYVQWLERAATARPTALEPKLLLARYYLGKQKPDKALSLASNAAREYPRSLEALEVLGSAQMGTGDMANALTTFRGMVDLAPAFALAHYRLGNVLATRGDTDGARKSFSRAVDIDSSALDPLTALVTLELGIKRYEQALQGARRIQRQHPDLPLGYALEGDVLLAQGKPALAAGVYRRAESHGNSSMLAINLYRALLLNGKRHEAEQTLLRWLKENSADQTIRAVLADAYLQSGRNREAISQYEALLQSDPQNTLALNNLAWLYHQQGDSRALTTAEQAYRLQPKSSPVMDTLGWILVQNGEVRRGLEMLHKAAESKQAPLGVRYRLAVALAKAGQPEQARKELERLLATGRSFPERGDAQALLSKL